MLRIIRQLIYAIHRKFKILSQLRRYNAALLRTMDAVSLSFKVCY